MCKCDNHSFLFNQIGNFIASFSVVLFNAAYDMTKNNNVNAGE